MRFYGMQPSEYAAIDSHQRHDLYLHIERIRARERLEFIADLSAIFSDDKRQMQEYLKDLAETAYPFNDEDDKLAVVLEAITR